MSAEESPELGPRTFTAGSRIFTEGEEGNAAYIVESGKVEISHCVNGTPVTVNIIEPEGLFGEMALIDNAPRCASATAMVKTVCLVIPREALESTLGNTGAFARKIVFGLVHNLRVMTERMVMASMGDKK